MEQLQELCYTEKLENFRKSNNLLDSV